MVILADQELRELGVIKDSNITVGYGSYMLYYEPCS